MTITNRPKRQRTYTVLLKDRGTTAAMVATLTVFPNRILRKSGLLLTAGMEDDQMQGAYDRLDERCQRLGRLLQGMCFA